MKYIFLVCLLTVSCIGYSQRTPKIKGNKSVVEVVESLPPFNSIELNDDLEIYLQASSNEGYTIEADDNLIDILKFRVENETLFISSYYKVTSKRKLNITVNFNQLYRIEAHEGKIINKERFSTDALEVNTFGSARVEIDVNAAVLNLNMEENSTGDFKVDSDSLYIKLTDRADLRLYGIMETTVVGLDNNSDADIEGVTNELQFSLFENADLKARRLEANTIQATLEGNTSAEVLATLALELNSKGSAKTYVYGDGKINLSNFLDTSELYRRKN